MALDCFTSMLSNDQERAHKLVHFAIDKGADFTHDFINFISIDVVALREFIVGFCPLTDDAMTHLCSELRSGRIFEKDKHGRPASDFIAGLFKPKDGDGPQ